MKIQRALFCAGASAFFFDDQRAIKNGARREGFVYRGAPVTPGFRSIREAGQSISIMLVLEDGRIGVGDCAAVQYSGAGGRDPLFLADHYVSFLETHVRPRLEGRVVGPFREMAAEFAGLRIADRPLHSAVQYGLTQALLAARAAVRKRMPCEVILEEYRLPTVLGRVPIFGQTGDAWHENADKMILKGVEVLPHGLINSLDEKLGRDGGKLREYIGWLARRIRELRGADGYRPTLHIDVYGMIGTLYDGNLDRVADYLASLERETDGLPLYIEGPVDMEERERHIAALRTLTERLAAAGSPIKIVADEWCNTFQDIRDFCAARAGHMVQIKTPDLGGIQNVVDSVLHCKAAGMEAYQGGTCNETEVSARLCVHVACATRPDRMLAKPGMGFDEGFTIVNNEMERVLRVLRWRAEDAAPIGRGA